MDRITDLVAGTAAQDDFDIAAAGNGGAVAIGDVNSGGTLGGVVGVGDTRDGAVAVDAGDVVAATDLGISADGGVAVAAAGGGVFNVATTTDFAFVN